jgi:general secretion pathway protein G
MTLIEILAVVVILGLLAATLVGGLSGKLGTARHELAKTQIAQVVNAIEAFNLANGRPPTASDGLQVLSANPQAPFFLEAGKLLDPWSKPYQYLIPGPNGMPYEVVTFGADGQQGGTGENADVSSVDLRR